MQAQSIQSLTYSDTLTTKTSIELDYLQLKIQTVSLQDSTLIREISLFEQLYKDAFQSGDMNLARFYLSSAKDLINNSKGLQSKPIFTPASEKKLPQGGNSSSSDNQFYVMGGMDVSRQDFEIVYNAKDSSLLDATNNPITGIGVDGHWGFLHSGVLRWNGILKFSRDYSLTNWHGDIEKSFWGNQTSKFWADIEGMSYKRDIQLKYGQILTGLIWRGNLSSSVTGFAQYEFLRRRYDHQDESFPDYVRNQLWGGLRFNAGFLTNLQVSAQTEIRRHDSFHQLDYSNTIYSAKIQYMSTKRTKISLQLDRRFLLYPNAPGDSTFYLGSYRDWFFNFQAEQGVTNWLSFSISGNLTSREYQNHSTYLQDFNYFKFTPAARISVNSFLSFELGYLNIQKKYQFDKNATGLAAVKNYSVTGPTFAIDFLNMKNLMISTSISYEFRRYHDSNAESISGFNLYTDQNETTAMLFLSWQFGKNWEFNAIAHRDAAIDQELEHNDSRLSLFTIEIKRSF